MKLFLSGGGGEPFSLDKKFVNSLDKSKPLLYIPIAMNPKRHSYSECFDWITKYFSKFNLSSIEMLTNLRNFPKKELDKFGGVYIGGGNTPRLLKELKESGFWEHLKYLIKKDIPISGGSAGAIIFAKTIIPSLSADENNVGLTNFNAMNRLQGYDLWAHYNLLMDPKIKEYMKKYELEKIIALPENCGIYVNDELMTIIGNHSAFIFDSKGKKEVKRGKIVK